MNELLNKIVRNEDLMTAVFLLDEYYEDSFFYGEMKEYSLYNRAEYENRKHYLRNQYIADNTEWIYQDTGGNLYGILDKFIVLSDSEGTLEYFCEKFQDIPLYLRKRMEKFDEYDFFKEKIKTFHNLDVENEWDKYIKFCKANNIQLTNEEDFGQYAKQEEFNNFIEEEIKKMPEYI